MSFQRKNIENISQKNNPFIRLFKLFIWIGIILFIIKYIGYSHFKTEPLIQESINISVQDKENYLSVGEKLHLNKNYLKFYLKYNDISELEVGNYSIPENATLIQIFESLENPIFHTEDITLLEGWNIFDIDEYLTRKSVINKGEYINYAENSEKIIALTEFFPFLEGVSTLEGYLYPDTYTIDPAQFAINKFVILQLETFETKVYNKLFSNTDITLENIQSIINLASIVEKEEKNLDYKKTVAGILKKRLEEGWMIGADITVCYPHRLTANECKLVVSKYIREKNDYNTRTKTGLPKTPIGNPSYETIEASLNHKVTPYYFYLHNKKSQIFYAETNAQHEYNKSNYMN